MMRYLLVGTLSLLLACGGDEDGVGAEADADTQAVCTHTGFAPSLETAERDDDLGVLFYTASRGEAPNLERLSVDFYFPLGAKDEPHDFQLFGENLRDCHTCVTARRECEMPNCSSGKAFLAQSGRLEITSIGPAGQQLQATLHDVVLAEVEISLADLETTLVPNGETLCLQEQSIDLPITGPL